MIRAAICNFTWILHIPEKWSPSGYDRFHSILPPNWSFLVNVRSIFSQSLPLLQWDRIQFCLSFLQHLNILSVSSPTPFSLQDDLPDLLLMDKWHFPLRRRIILRKQCRCDGLSSSLIHFLQTLLHLSSRPLISPRHLQITYFIKTASSFGIGIMRLLRLEELWNKWS